MGSLTDYLLLCTPPGCRLPRLRRLVLHCGGPESPDGATELAPPHPESWLPAGLEHLSVSAARLNELPPALRRTPGLLSLHLVNNKMAFSPGPAADLVRGGVVWGVV